MSHEASDRRWRLGAEAMMGPGPAYDWQDSRRMMDALDLLDRGWGPMPRNPDGEHWLERGLGGERMGRGPRVWQHMVDLLAGRVPRLLPEQPGWSYPGPLAHREDLPAHEREVSAEAWAALQTGIESSQGGEARPLDPSELTCDCTEQGPTEQTAGEGDGALGRVSSSNPTQ